MSVLHVTGIALQSIGKPDLALGRERNEYFGREHLGDGIQAQQALSVGRMLVALLGLAIAKHDAVVAARDRQHHARRAGVDEHDGTREVARFRQHRIGGRRILRE